MSFGIILKYYSQGLSPLDLTLSPFSHLTAPNPLPSLWMLSPRHSFIVSAYTQWCLYFINVLHTYRYKIRPLACNP